MSINTTIKQGLIHKLPVETILIDFPNTKGNFSHNPSIARDSTGKLWISVRNNTVPTEKNLGLVGDGPDTPIHYINYLYVGLLDEKTLKVSGLKEIHPKDEVFFEWGIEDVRIFFRGKELWGIGVLVDTTSGKRKCSQAEILIDYDKGVYTLVRDYGNTRNHPEKNWGVPTEPTEAFDYAYSPTEIVKDGVISGVEYDGHIHGGTQLLPYKDGYITIAHEVMRVKGEKRYISVALIRNKEGLTTHVSQYWHLDVGWREHLKESVEFISGAVWSIEGSELLVTLGVKDVLCGAARIPVSAFEFEPFEEVAYYGTQFVEPPTRDAGY